MPPPPLPQCPLVSAPPPLLHLSTHPLRLWQVLARARSLLQPVLPLLQHAPVLPVVAASLLNPLPHLLLQLAGAGRDGRGGVGGGAAAASRRSTSGKGDGGGKGEGGAGGRGYSGYLGVTKTSSAGSIKKDYKQPEKNPRGNKEAERRSEQSSRSYDYMKAVHSKERRPAYENHRCAAEEKPKEKPASSDVDMRGWCPYHPWIEELHLHQQLFVGGFAAAMVDAGAANVGACVVSEMVTNKGYVAVLGKPNVDKSTLINQIAGQKLLIVTDKPQTTRHRILGICSEPEYQIILYDTPGVIKKEMHKLDSMMMKNVQSATGNADCVIVVADASKVPEKIDDMLDFG